MTEYTLMMEEWKDDSGFQYITGMQTGFTAKNMTDEKANEQMHEWLVENGYCDDDFLDGFKADVDLHFFLSDSETKSEDFGSIWLRELARRVQN